MHQLFIENWKDFDANLSTNLVLDFVRAVRQKVPENNKQPIVVHCRYANRQSCLPSGFVVGMRYVALDILMIHTQLLAFPVHCS